MMVAIAIIGVLMGGGIMLRRWAYFRKQAVGYGRIADALQEAMGSNPKSGAAMALKEYADPDDLRREAEHYAVKRDKYRHLAAHPWESDTPNPPPPSYVRRPVISPGGY